METVTIQCGACGQVIAVSKEHLGQQVQCPLCGAVIEAPAPAPVPLLPSNVNDEDSIFAPPEEDEDIFGRRDERPLVQMPSATALKPPPPADDDRTEALPAEQHYRPAPQLHAASTGDSQLPLTDASTHAELAGMAIRRPSGRNSFGAIVMIFLIPYSIVITFAVAYLVYERSQRGGLDMLRDPDRDDGAPRRIKHDMDLPARLRTTLGSSIALGDLIVTPLKVERNHDNDLVLHLKMQNASSDTQFNPFPDSFHRYMTRQSTVVPPYTFLEPAPNQGDMRLYGGYTARFRHPPEKRGAAGDGGSFSGVIGPQEVVYGELTTSDKDRYLVPRLLSNKRRLLWRVHLRRGFVSIGGRDVSATGVIGVEFPTDAILDQRG